VWRSGVVEAFGEGCVGEGVDARGRGACRLPGSPRRARRLCATAAWAAATTAARVSSDQTGPTSTLSAILITARRRDLLGDRSIHVVVGHLAEQPPTAHGRVLG
jgi:hypothetical protein